MTGNAGPHAVTSLSTGSGSVNFSYDANGNLTSGDAGNTGRTIAWSAYDKPVEITQGAITRTFAYGPDRQRYQQVHDEGSGPTTTTYVGDYYSRVDAGGGNELHKLYLYANGRVIAIVEDDADTGTGSTSTRYLHRDHLGSITLIVDDTGLERLSYDAWGQRRDATDWVGPPATTPTEVRGYTGHEHLDDVNLIHMNGRIYDPQLGRMVSGDPILQDPLNSQNYNRYSYVLNNPLKYTDPSGFYVTCVSAFSNDLHCIDPGQIDLDPSQPMEMIITGRRPFGVQSVDCANGACQAFFDAYNGSQGGYYYGAHGGGNAGGSISVQSRSSNGSSEAKDIESSQTVNNESSATKPDAAGSILEDTTRTSEANGSRTNHEVPGGNNGALNDSALSQISGPQVVAINGGGQSGSNANPAAQKGGLVAEGGSLALDFIPVIGSGKSVVQLFTGKDAVTGESVSRWGEAAGIVLGVIPFGKALTKWERVGDFGSHVIDAATPIGRRGNPMNVIPGTNVPGVIGGRNFTGHALDQMQGRGVMPSAVLDTIQTGASSSGRGGATIFTTDQLRVVVNPNGSVKTVMPQ